MKSIVNLYTTYFGEKTDGTFVEIGANDGESYSNTAMLADAGWRGYYVEPLHDAAELCRIRHAKNDVSVDECLIGETEGYVDFYRCKVNGGVSSTTYKPIVDNWDGDVFDKPIQLYQTTLQEYLECIGVKPGFEVLLIDTEGTDYQVLNSCDLDHWQPKIIIIEICNNADNKELTEKKLRVSYTCIYEDHENAVWVRHELTKPDKEGIAADVIGIMSVPRLIMCDCVWCLIGLCSQTKIDICRASGPYWGQAMNKIMNDNLYRYKYLLGIDSDGLFTTKDVLLLYDIMEKRPDIDALAGMQMQRNETRAIAGYQDEYFKDNILSVDVMFCDTFAVDYAHFGLTLIRTESLQKVPKPWFVGDPGKDGNWGNDRVDEDIYFWNHWREHGNNIHIANNVPIGHIEFRASWPSRTLQKTWQYPHEFFNEGQPEDCWPMKVTQVLPDDEV